MVIPAKIKQAIVLDLDDTIFETKTMDPVVFEPFFGHLRKQLTSLYEQTVIDTIIADLWKYTWDKVMADYAIPIDMISDSINILNRLELKLKISPYPDYQYLRKIHNPKYLVTTSVTSLQRAKIKALNIEQDFVDIRINDTFKESKTKLDIFKELIMKYKLDPEHTFVIGDNPDSEIKAGNELNMITIQILRDGGRKGNNARYYIESFEELESILKKNV